MMARIGRYLAGLIIKFAQWRGPTKYGGHIYGHDGSLYMERWKIFEGDWLNVRVHHIARRDEDRHLHDHPWNWASLVLRNGYIEAVPRQISPEFEGDKEIVEYRVRVAGDFCVRRALDRHRIASVRPGTYTLFITGPKINWWGFITRQGKVYYRDYLKAGSTQ